MTRKTITSYEATLHAQIRALEKERDALRSALREAMEWNWLDDDMPTHVVAQCEKALVNAGEQQ